MAFPTDFLREVNDPSVSALIMWDFQVGLAGRALDLDQLVETNRRLLEAADSAGVPVIWSRHTVPDLSQVTAGSLYRMMKKQKVTDPAELKPFMQEGSPEREYVPQIGPRPHTGEEDALPTAREPSDRTPEALGSGRAGARPGRRRDRRSGVSATMRVMATTAAGVRMVETPVPRPAPGEIPVWVAAS